MAGGYVYLMRLGDRHKIGASSCPEERRRQLAEADLGHVYLHQKDGHRQYALGARMAFRRANTLTLANVLLYLATLAGVAGGVMLACLAVGG